MKWNIPWIAAAAMTVLAFAFSAAMYPRLPDTIPIHWNIEGVADGHGHKSWAAWTLPGAMLVMLAVFAALPRISPRNFEVTTFQATYDQIVALVIALFGFLHVLSLAGAVHGKFEMGRTLLAGLFLFFALMGNLMGQVQRNFWVGIRVPWTLSSELVWNDTHRLAAWLWVGAGLIGMVLALLGWGSVGLGVLLVAVLVPVVYSYFHYKKLEGAGQI